MDTEQTNQSLEQLLGTLLRRAPWILLCLVLAGGAAYGFSKHQTKKYTATASLVFNENQLTEQVAGLPTTNSSNQQVQQNTNLKLVQLGDTAAKTASRLGYGVTKQQVSDAVSVSAQGESNIVDVSATATSPALAAIIANTYAEQFVAQQQDSSHAYYGAALKLVERQLAGLSRKERSSAAGLALQSRAQSLGVLAELRSGNVQIAQAATVPSSPSSPKVARNTALGAVLGLLLGLGVAFLIDRFDRRIREPDDLSAIYHLPMLGIVPQSRALARASRPDRRASRELLPAREAEVFQLIRAHLRYFNVEREMRTLLVTSAASGDGKTTVARHLAVATASVGATVLLLEADLRRPSIAEQLAIASGPGLSDVLIGSVSLWRATQPVALDQPPGATAHPLELDVLVAGALAPPNPAELLASYAMTEVLDQARETYDLVVLDTSPLSIVSDAFPLLREVDGVVVVGRVGRNRRPVAERLYETLDGVGAPLLGVIANGVKARQLRSYAYDYDYTSEETHGPTMPADEYDTQAGPDARDAVSSNGSSSSQPRPTVGSWGQAAGN